jgi:DNA-binding winged helix-turn-helix (wHTH) protein
VELDFPFAGIACLRVCGRSNHERHAECQAFHRDAACHQAHVSTFSLRASHAARQGFWLHNWPVFGGKISGRRCDSLREVLRDSQVYSKALAVCLCFGPFTLSLDTRQLKRAGREIHLTPKAFELLAALVQARPAVLSKNTLLDRLWSGTFVTEANLSNLAGEIRRALRDKADRPEWIRTVHGFGYAFCGEATTAPESPRKALDQLTCWLSYGHRRFALGVGEHVIGRDPDVEIRLDAPTVSRRHARLVVTPEAATIEDLESKNGTLRGRDRITSPIRLADGDAIHIGALRLIFYTRGRRTTTQTLERPSPA